MNKEYKDSNMDDLINKISETRFTNEEFVNKQEVKERLMRSIGRKKRARVIRLSFAAAASVLFLCLLSYVLFYSTVTISTTKGEALYVYLPDSSIVTLQEGSTISYNRFEWYSKKDINLQGEAYFCVTKGKDFRVITELGTISVLGTKFNVDCRTDSLQVRCDEGKVRVDTPDGVIFLTPQKDVSPTPDEETIVEEVKEPESEPEQTTEPEPEPTYKNYKNTPLSVVINEIEKRYGVEIVGQGTDVKYNFSGTVPTGNLAKALTIISASCDLSFEIDGNKIILKPNNNEEEE